MSFRRLWAALWENQAHTHPEHPDGSLRGRTYAIPFAQVWAAAADMASEGLRGWTVVMADEDLGILQAECRDPGFPRSPTTSRSVSPSTKTHKPGSICLPPPEARRWASDTHCTSHPGVFSGSRQPHRCGSWEDSGPNRPTDPDQPTPCRAPGRLRPFRPASTRSRGGAGRLPAPGSKLPGPELRKACRVPHLSGGQHSGGAVDLHCPDDTQRGGQGGSRVVGP